MKMVKAVLILFVFFTFSSAENEDYKLINSIAFPNAKFFTTDNLGNAYVIVENQLLQFDALGKPLANYNENNFVIALRNLFADKLTEQLISKYFIGTSDYWNGANVFWQIDMSGRILKEFSYRASESDLTYLAC